ncbi:Gldg family protein [Parapedobacter koreensis]|uniref:ABC-2 type transport system permease protein n=1 Tax=Parapedobacter koreensis TaxID=332977 RepID=A0A1H7U718_9SPHI|nr:Gldg family protein [Parapedobacter koreensis]SEL92832.1 ABC-2 type transport system permease protein [Parapedobacter koreensis]
MRKIGRIARLELAVLFYSPIAWLLLVVFAVQGGITYTGILYAQETAQQLGRPLNVLTRVLFAGEEGLLTQVSTYLYLYVPLLTMGLLSREIASGSIKLLQSSPVTSVQVVLGKFAAMAVYGLLLCGVVLLYLPAACWSVQALDVRFVLAGIMALYVLLCVYSAIGLLLSSLTGYPLVAAVGTLAVLAAFNHVGSLWQGTDVLRDMAYWLSLSGKVEGLINGLVTSRDVLYLVALVAYFLSLTIVKLSHSRQHRPWYRRMTVHVSLSALLVGIAYCSSRSPFIGYWDTTRIQDQTFSTKSQQLLQRLEKPVKLTTYTNLLDRNVAFGEPSNRISDQRRFERLQRFLPHMQLDYITYYDSVPYGLDTTRTLKEQAREVAGVRGFDFDRVLSPAQIRRRIDLSDEGNTFVRMLEYDGRYTPLRMYDDLFQYPGEAEVMAAVKRLLDGPTPVWVLTGHQERSLDKAADGAYQLVAKGRAVRASLINQGFEPHVVDLRQVAAIPATLGALIIADPLEAYGATELTKIAAYIAGGGNLLLAGEPGKQHLINPIAEMLGMRLGEGTVLQESAYNELDRIEAQFAPQADSLGFGFFEGATVGMPGAAPLEVVDSTHFTVVPLLTSRPASWRKLGPFDLANEPVVFDSTQDARAQHLLLAALYRRVGKREQRIILSGDADFMGNREIAQRYGVQNASFVIGRLFRWFSDGEYPYSPNTERATDRTITVGRTQIKQQQILLIAVVPALIASIGVMILIRRRRR